MNRSLLILFVLLGLESISGAQVIQVPKDMPTIQAGINAADEGDTVLIAEGTYYENINFSGKAITLASHFLIDGNPAHIFNTIIDGSQFTDPDTASVVIMWSGEDTCSVLAGFTITGGAGTLVRNIHKDSVFANFMHRSGGGILIFNSGGKIIHNIIGENHLVASDNKRGTLGGGIAAAVNNNHSLVVRNNTIRENSGTGPRGWGGGASLHGGRIIVEHNTIMNNSLHVRGISCGAGVCYENESQEGTIEEAVIRNNVISGNTGYSHEKLGTGGGIALNWSFENEKVQLYNNLISSNFTEGRGGAISTWSNKSDIYKNVLIDNMASLYDNNIFLDDGSDVSMNQNIRWSGNAWLGTAYGLVKLSTGTGSMPGFKNQEGIQIKPFSSSFCIDPKTGKMMVGDKNGMISFRPEELPVNSFVTPVIIIDFRYGTSSPHFSDTSTLMQARRQSNRLDLSFRENVLYFKYAVLENNSLEKKQYKYLMEGVDRDTILAGTDRTAIYHNLKPGRYRFWVSSTTGEGGWDPEGISMDIRIHPPWYRTGLASVLYGISVILIILVIIRVRTKRLRKEKAMLEKEVVKRTMEIRRKNEQILGMEQLKTRFFTDISHEIRTPLSLISGPLDKLIKEENQDPETGKWLSIIRQNSKRLLQLVNQLLDISRLDSGHMKLVLEETDVIRHLHILVSEYLSLAESRKIRFIIDVPDIALIEWYDREKVGKITTNLLSNAFKFTPENGVITCRIKVSDGQMMPKSKNIRIIVADTGPGIPVEEREKIFERFYRVENDLYADTGGTGIGLSLTRELIRLMHGEVRVKSLEGTGAVFMVTIPLGKDHLEEKDFILKKSEKQKQQKAPREIDQKTSPGVDVGNDPDVKVLLVEDNVDLRTFIRENIDGQYTVIEASDGIEGLHLARSIIPDIIISDVMMPAMDGMELCRKLKNDERTSHIPVVMLTAKSSGKDRMEGLELGADDYILKPFDMEELLARIRNLLEQREVLRKKYSSMIELDWGKISVTTLDEQFLKKSIDVISECMQDFDFNVNALQKKMSMSRETLYRKMKALTGDSPSKLIQIMRLKTAASLLEKGEINITEVALNSGYSNSSYFARSFKKHYGIPPLEYKRKHNKYAV